MISLRIAPLALLFLISGLAFGNALDRIDFGNSQSETSHAMESKLTLLGIGALGQTYRAPAPITGEAPATEQDQLAFTLKVDPVKQNYFTVRLWGGDQQSAGIWLQGTPKVYGAMDWNGGPPPFPGRFYYITIPIPMEQTQGKTSARLVVYQNNAPQGLPVGRPVYSAYTHTETQLVPPVADVTGLPIPLTGQIAPKVLTAADILALLRKNRTALFSPDGYVDQMLARQIPAGTPGAPPEVIGLDLWMPLAEWVKTPRSADEWRNQAGGRKHGAGYSTMPDEFLSVLSSIYLLPPLLDENGKPIPGLDRYRDPELLRRIIAVLDASTYVQSSDGSFNDNGWDDVNNISAEGHWQGLTSSPRAAGHPYAGTTKRGGGWSLTLEGANTATFGWVFLSLLADPVAAPLFKQELAGSFDADLNGKPMRRIHVYQRMLNNQVSYQARIFGGGTVSQALMAANSIYTNSVALRALHALAPYPEKTTSFPKETVIAEIEATYPALSVEQTTSYLEQCLGVKPVTSIMGNLYRKEYENFAISRGGLGEAGGTISGGYDGRYGTILPWLGSNMVHVAAWDPAVPPATLARLRSQAGVAVDAYTRFISPNENFKGQTNLFTLAQEDFITYRNPYNPNANANRFTTGSRYILSNPKSGMSTPLSLRAAYLEALYGQPPNQLEYLRYLSAYEATMRAWIDIDPAKVPALPGEPGQPDSAWVDVQTGATAVYWRGERFYLNAKWRNDEASGKGASSNLARIHYTTPAIDRGALVCMPHDKGTVQSDGNLTGSRSEPWVVRYGKWLVMGNPGNSSATLKLPPGKGNAYDLISRKSLVLGSSLQVEAGKAAVVILSGERSAAPVAGPEQLFEGGTYALLSANSMLALDASLKQQPRSSGADQQWFVSWKGSVITLKNVATGDCLADVDGLRLVNPSAASAQQWSLVANGIGFVLLNVATGRTIDVTYGDVTPGQSVSSQPYGGGLNQVWHFAAPGK